MIKTKSQNREIAPPMPSSIEVERGVLGAIVMDNKAMDECSVLRESDFFMDSHRALFRRIVAMHDNSEPVNLVTLYDKLVSAGELQRAGGHVYLSTLIDGLPKIADLPGYIKILRKKAMLRRTIEIGELAQKLAFESADEAESIVDQALQGFLNLAIDGAGFEFVEKSSRKAAVSLYNSLEGATSTIRVNTGIEELDKFTGGFRPGELVTVTAGTGVGKTFFAQQIKRKACSEGLHGLYFSGEMAAEQLVSREIATESGVEHWKMRRPERLTAEDRDALVTTIAEECEKCGIIDGELSVRGIRLSARRKKRLTGLSWIVIDYDELVDAPGKDEFAQQRLVIREAKSLAITLQVPVIMLSQLRKALDSKEAKRPTLERLYGTGAKSKHSSFVIYVDREYVREMKGDEAKAQIYILKARDGRITMINATFDLTTLRFRAETEEEHYLRSKKKKETKKNGEAEEG